jgi:2-polyprenyl-3-methyl-5-hydroxy-6-metoxy-1,4-benzoquinol methylase
MDASFSPSVFWNEKYSDSDYIYGENPNDFLKEQLDKLSPGKLLLPADGEGRNAVYAARQEWNVEAFDLSERGREKAFKLARKYGVSIDYKISSFEEFKIKPEQYDAIGLVYAHQHRSHRRQIHRKLITGLKVSGTLILEAFSKDQLKYDSGGPKDEAMLYSLEELKEDFDSLKLKFQKKQEIFISEGSHHRGKADVLRIVAKK